jgi:hypothetical protein
MAYCKYTKNCDLYLYAKIGGGYVFQMRKPPWNGRKKVFVPTAAQALKRIRRLRGLGYQIPEYAQKRLIKESLKGKTNDCS